MIRIFFFFLMLFSSIASAFVLPVPAPVPAVPSVFPSAQSLPQPLGSGSAGAGQILSKVPGGQTAGVICMTINCSSSIAMNQSGIFPPVGWPSDPSTGIPSPPKTASTNKLYCGSGDKFCASTPDAAYNAAVTSWHTPYTFKGCGADGVDYRCSHIYQGDSYSSIMFFRGYTCPAGYTSSSTGCVLSNPAVVQKPAGTPCQTIMSNGLPRWDTSNPECSSRGAGPFWTDSDGNKETIDPNAGTFSVVSADGKKSTIVGPASGNTIPILDVFTLSDSSGVPHTFKTLTNVDSSGNVTGQSYYVDGNPVSKQQYNDVLAGNPSASVPSTSNPSNASGSVSTGGSTVSINCTDVNTCGVAQDSTLKDVAAKTGAIQTSLSDFFKNFTTAVTVPQLYTPSTTTAQSALQDFSNQIKATPIVTSVTGFFDVNFQGGACPTWTIPVVNVMGLSIGGIEIDQFCTSTAYRVYSIIAVVTLVVCGFFAFRVAVDN